MVGNVEEVFPGRNATSGGSSETEVKDETVMPTGLPAASSEVIAVIPLGKCPRTERNLTESKPGGSEEAR